MQWYAPDDIILISIGDFLVVVPGLTGSCHRPGPIQAKLESKVVYCRFLDTRKMWALPNFFEGLAT